DRDVTAIWEDGNLQAGHAPDRRRPRTGAIENEARRHVAGRGAHSLDSAAGNIDAGDRNALFQARPQTPRGSRVPGGDVGRARDAVGGTERAAEDVVDVENRHHALGLGGVHPPGLAQADPMPQVHVVPEVLHLLWLRENEEVADLAEVGGVADLLLEALQHAHRHPLQPDVALTRELLAHPARALAGRLRAQRLAFEQQHVDISPPELIGERAAHDAAARDDYVSAFHARTCPRTRRSA